MGKIKNKGFTFLEVLIAISIVVLLTAGIIFIIDPGEQFARNRDKQREIHLNAILHAIKQKLSHNKEEWVCGAGAIQESPTLIGTEINQYNLYPCIYPDFLSNPVFDPKDGYFNSLENYSAGYAIWQNSETKKISLSAPGAELEEIYLGESPE